MPKVVEENLPPMATPVYDIETNMYVVYVNKARQIVHLGPGATRFECPLVPGLSKGEIQRFVGEIHKLSPQVEIRVVHGSGGTAIFTMNVDGAYRDPTPDKVDLTKVGGDATHRRLWEVCRDQADYVSGRDTNNHEQPDCSMGCRYFHPLMGDHGMDWGVCTEPKSPRAGLLTFEHMGCPFYDMAPEDPTPEPPAPKPKATAKKKPGGVNPGGG